jgi:hypothetical protein
MYRHGATKGPPPPEWPNSARGIDRRYGRFRPARHFRCRSLSRTGRCLLLQFRQHRIVVRHERLQIGGIGLGDEAADLAFVAQRE